MNFRAILTIVILFAAAPVYAATLSPSITLSGGTILTLPAASPSAGTYTSAQSVTLAANGAESIAYTTDGSDPVCFESEEAYFAPIDVSSSLTIHAVSCYWHYETQSDTVSFTYTITPQSSPAPSGGGNGPITGSYGISGGGEVLGASITPHGEVLGASTSTVDIEETAEEATTTPACSEPLLMHYLHIGRENDANDVRALQNFLNQLLGLSLPATGVYDQATFYAVELFQLTYWQDVLAPWVPHGLQTEHTPTGYVYKTTSWKLNQLHCAALESPFPTLP